MALRDQVVQAVGGAQRDGERQDHREAREDRARDEVGREDRRVPPGELRDGEVEADDGVDGDDERRGEAGEEQVGDLVPLPVPRGASPAEREHAVDDAPDAALRAVAERGEVGDEPDVPEHQRDREVGGHREHVPHQRAPELRPERHRVGVRGEPVEELRAAEVEDREDPGAHDREDRHRLGEAVDRLPPLLPEEEQDRRDQRAGVTDADPPDEVGDREPPGDRDVDPPDADADVEQHRDRHREQRDQAEPDREAEEPSASRAAGEDDAGDLVGDRGIGVRCGDDGRGGRGRHLRRARGWGSTARPDRSSGAAC